MPKFASEGCAVGVSSDDASLLSRLGEEAMAGEVKPVDETTSTGAARALVRKTSFDETWSVTDRQDRKTFLLCRSNSSP